VLTDHASMNGTYLNRERVETKEVVAGDKIQIGRTIMKVQ